MSADEGELSQLVYELNRNTATAAPIDKRSSLDSLLVLAAQQNASDLLLVSGSPATLRVKGALLAASAKPLGSPEIRQLLLPLLSPAQTATLESTRSLDLCFVRPNVGRFRANLHFQRDTLAASIRLLPPQIPTLESLHLPPILGQLTTRRQGLILVTGPTGSGKTSTLAALIDRINAQRRDHILTIEDPIEYQHANRSSIVEQIEVGRDTPSFAHAVRAVLRQNPDVILVGEMRDSETIAAALTAAETGHLVLSTLHTNDAAQTMSRILDSFSVSNQPQIRQQLSLALLAVLAQQLVPTSDPAGLYPAVEIMMATTAIRNLIRTGQDHQVRSHISTGRRDGMTTMDQSLAELVRAGRITRETAFAHCFHPDELTSNLNVL